MAAVIRILLALAVLAGPAFAAPLAEKAVPADLPAIMAIERTSFSAPERWDKGTWRQALADPAQSVLVIRAEDGRAAAALAYDRGEDATNKRLYISTLGVHPDHRKRGYGEALMREALGEASRDPSLRGASLHVRVDNEGAQKLYRKLGFRTLKRVSRYYEESGVDAFYMVWDK